jgi:predicted AlkP superfamily phosphohydrolase/phosphomutase
MTDSDSGPPGADRAVVLGLDGVPWGLLRDWVEAGHLPNFGRLFDEGASGVLESTTPAHTALAWPSIATGTWPDQHGVYDFQRLQSDHTHRMNTSRDVARPALWELVEPAVAGNVPMTYPATDVDGAVVSGMMTPRRDEGFAHPTGLVDAVADEIPGYEIGLDWGEYADREGEFQDDLVALLSARNALRETLQQRVGDDWRLFFFVYTAPDRLQHLVWDEDVLLSWYERFDDVVGDVMDYAAEHDALLAVVSDHGFGPNETVVSAAKLLEDAGYLVRREQSGVRGVLAGLGIDKDSVLSKLERIGISEQDLVDYVPQGFVDVAAMQVPGEHSLYDVDHANTAAFAHGAGNVYVNDTARFEDGVVDPAQRPAVKAELVELFEGVTDPESGDRVFDVTDGGDLFPRDDSAPDLVLSGRGGYEVLTMLTEEVFHDADTKAAGHRPEGVFFAWGPGMQGGSRVRDASVVDVAPTVLHAIGEPVPEHVDGDVLRAAFDPDGEPAGRDPEFVDLDYDAGDPDGERGVDGDPGDVEDRLRGLGYIE